MDSYVVEQSISSRITTDRESRDNRSLTLSRDALLVLVYKNMSNILNEILSNNKEKWRAYMNNFNLNIIRVIYSFFFFLCIWYRHRYTEKKSGICDFRAKYSKDTVVCERESIYPMGSVVVNNDFVSDPDSKPT